MNESDLYEALNHLAWNFYGNARDHGWHEPDKTATFGERIALIHSELSEALEEYRAGHELLEIYYHGEKPEGVAVELADVLIRLLDLCAVSGIDIGHVTKLKHEYNKSRPYRHGGKVI